MAILKDFHKLEICWLYAEGKSYAVIVDHFKEKYGMTVWRGQIQGYVKPGKASQKWLDIIAEHRIAFEKEFMRVPVASKRIRLERTEDVFKKAMNHKPHPKLRTALASLELARREIEKDKVHIEHSTKDGEPLQHKITHFPPEPKDLADWEKQVAEATEKRKEQEAIEEKDEPALLTQ
jgi:hypothetical protein